MYARAYKTVLIPTIYVMYFRNFGKFTVIPCASGFASITQQRVNRRAAKVSERLTGCININASVIMRSKIKTIII